MKRGRKGGVDAWVQSPRRHIAEMLAWVPVLHARCCPAPLRYVWLEDSLGRFITLDKSLLCFSISFDRFELNLPADSFRFGKMYLAVAKGNVSVFPPQKPPTNARTRRPL